MWDMDFGGIGEEDITLLPDAALVVEDDLGKVVKISADKTAGLCAAEDNFYGILKGLEDGACGVQRKGFAQVSYTGALVFGYVELVADGAGGVKPPAVAGTGMLVHVIEVNETDLTLWIDLG